MSTELSGSERRGQQWKTNKVIYIANEVSEQSRKKTSPPHTLPLPHTGLGRWQEGGQGDGACWRFVAKVKWRPAANLHFMCQFLHFLSSYQREQSCWIGERGKSVRHAVSKWVRVLRIQAGSQSLSFPSLIMNMMGSLAASLGISAGQWGAILATKI